MEIISTLSESLIAFLATLLTTVIYFGLSRYTIARRIGRNVTQEIAKNDNFAYSLSYASILFSFGLSLAPFIHAIPNTLSIAEYCIYSLSFGVLVAFLLEAGRYLHDKLILHRFDENRALSEKNMAGAIVDALSVVANTIIIQGLLAAYLHFETPWVDTTKTAVVLIGFYASAQFLLFAVSRWREYLYSRTNQGMNFQYELRHGNVSVALRHGGFLVSSAILFKLAVVLLPASINATVDYLLTHGALLIGLVVTTFSLNYLLSKLVLIRVNQDVEVDHQDNRGVAYIQLAINLGLAFALLNLLT